MDNMQLWLSSSTDSINLNDSAEGFYLNPDLEGLTGLPEIRSVNGLNAGYDGGWTATQLWAARLITIRGVIAINNKAAIETKRKALAKILSQGKDEDLELKFVSEAGNTYTTTVRTSYCTMALQRVFWRQEYQIQLRANDPLIYDDGGSELIAILRVMAGEGGFEIPFDIPFDIGGSITPTSIDVGDEATYPLIRLKGDLHSPTIINMTTNQRMQVLADIITTVEWHDYTATYTTNGFAQISNGLDGAPLSLTHLHGNTTQTTLSGKNLLPTLNTTRTISDVKFTPQADGSILVNGTATAQINYPINVDSASVAQTLNIGAGTYTVSGGANSVAGSAYVQAFYQESGTTKYANGTFTTTGATLGAYIRVVNGATISNKIIYPQLEKGSPATNFEEYCGGVPSPNPGYPQTVNNVTGLQTVRITGKNLFDKSEAPVSVSADTSISELPTGIRLTLGAPGTYRNARYMTGVKLSVGQSITISGIITPSGTNNGRISIATCDANGGNRVTREYIETSGRKAFTLTSAMASTPYIQLYFYSNLGSATAQAGDYVDYTDVQLELGSTATTYEPYQGASYEINLGGQNLCPNEFEQGGISNTTGANNSDTAVRTTNYATVKENTTYTASTNKGTNIAIRYYKSDGTFIGSGTTASASGNTFTTPALTARVRFVITNTTDTSQNFMLNEGSTVLPYAPYTTYQYELCKIGTYQDYIYKDGGKWYKHAEVGKVVYTGDADENWSTQSGTSYTSVYAHSQSDMLIAPVGVIGIMSDNYTGILASELRNEAQKSYGIALSNSANRVFIKNIDCADSTAFKTWLSTHNTTVYYALATPTDTEITDADLIEQLEHIYSLYGGINNLFLIPSAGAQGEMEVSYATAEDIDYHEVVIDCQARTVTQDGHNLYPALADGSEFIRLLPGENKLYLTSEVESDNGTAEVKFKKGNISI